MENVVHHQLLWKSSWPAEMEDVVDQLQLKK